MKKDKIKPVRIILGLIFISAAIFRIFNYSVGIEELSRLNMPSMGLIPMIIFELAIGAMFISGYKVKLAALLTSLFLAFGLVIALIANFTGILSNIWELFVFDANPTDMLLHTIYLVILIYIFKRTKPSN